MIGKLVSIMLDALFSYLIDFKTDKQRQEYYDKKLHPRLKTIVRLYAFANYMLHDKKTVVTEVFRSQKENDKIYGWEPGCKKKRKVSVHSDWRGIDVRTADTERKEKDSPTFSEASVLAKMLNAIPYDESRPRIKTAKFGDERHLNHIHFQVVAT